MTSSGFLKIPYFGQGPQKRGLGGNHASASSKVWLDVEWLGHCLGDGSDNFFGACTDTCGGAWSKAADDSLWRGLLQRIHARRSAARATGKRCRADERGGHHSCTHGGIDLEFVGA